MYNIHTRRASDGDKIRRRSVYAGGRCGVVTVNAVTFRLRPRGSQPFSSLGPRAYTRTQGQSFFYYILHGLTTCTPYRVDRAPGASPAEFVYYVRRQGRNRTILLLLFAIDCTYNGSTVASQVAQKRCTIQL